MTDIGRTVKIVKVPKPIRAPDIFIREPTKTPQAAPARVCAPAGVR